jgi:hypothetical protein
MPWVIYLSPKPKKETLIFEDAYMDQGILIFKIYLEKKDAGLFVKLRYEQGEYLYLDLSQDKLELGTKRQGTMAQLRSKKVKLQVNL